MLADGGITKQNSSNNMPAMAQAVTFVGAKVFCISKFFKNFIAKIIVGPDENNDYEVKFLKRSSKVNNGLSFPKSKNLLRSLMMTLFVDCRCHNQLPALLDGQEFLNFI